MKRRKRPDRLILIAWLVLFAFLVAANVLTPLWGDDYCYIIPPAFFGPFVLAWRDWFAWTGRYFASALLYGVMATGWRLSMLPFDALNALVFIAMVRNVLALAALAASDGARPPRAGVLDVAFAALALWWLPRSIAEVALWKTGAIGYLWPMAGELWVLRLMLGPEGGQRWWWVPFAFVIATFLEPLSVVVSVLAVAACVWRRRHGLSVPYGLAAGHAAGTLFLLAAPGNFVRAATLAPSGPLDRIMGVAANFGSLFDPTWITALLIVALACLPARHPWAVVKAGRGWVFLALALFYMLVLLGVPRPALAARVSFPASVFLVCWLVAVFLRRSAAVLPRAIVAVVLLVLCVLHGAVVFPDLAALARIDHRWAADPQFRSGPATNVVLPQSRVHGRLFYARKHEFFEGLTPDPAYFANVCYARAMGVRTVVAR